MSEAGVLNVVLWLPLAGLAWLALPAQRSTAVAQRTLVLMLVQLALTLWLYTRFDASVAGLQFETRLPWIPAWGVAYQIGLDGANLLLVLLTALLGPLVVAGAFTAIQQSRKLFYAMVLLIQFAMMGCLLAQDLFVFYLFWEAMLIPMFFMIGIWGGAQRIRATSCWWR
jgi:NADH-quinone oxidoreductase subunit M